MEKLIKLLNKYEKEKEKETWLKAYEWESYWDWHLIQATNIVTKGKKTPLALIETRSLLISKTHWFIKWLVENNRIDIERLHKIVDYMLVIKENYVNAHDYNSDCLLMLLAISNTPISDLISYLK